MTAASLEVALRALGVECAVETRGALAVLVARAGAVDALATAATRRAATELAREHGFSHVALELVDDDAGAATGAPLPRD